MGSFAGGFTSLITPDMISHPPDALIVDALIVDALIVDALIVDALIVDALIAGEISADLFTAAELTLDTPPSPGTKWT